MLVFVKKSCWRIKFYCLEVNQIVIFVDGCLFLPVLFAPGTFLLFIEKSYTLYSSYLICRWDISSFWLYSLLALHFSLLLFPFYFFDCILHFLFVFFDLAIIHCHNINVHVVCYLCTLSKSLGSINWLGARRSFACSSPFFLPLPL